MKTEGKDLIWVDKAFAEKYKKLDLEEEKAKALDEYIETIEKKSKEDFKANLESLEEDVAIYTGLMLKVKQAFKAASDENLNASYELWENFDKQKPIIQKKIDTIISMLKPLKNEAHEISELLGKIQTWNIDKFVESLRSISDMQGTRKKMIEFLIKNFKDE
jgi:hypothetical protein